MCSNKDFIIIIHPSATISKQYITMSEHSMFLSTVDEHFVFIAGCNATQFYMYLELQFLVACMNFLTICSLTGEFSPNCNEDNLLPRDF